MIVSIFAYWIETTGHALSIAELAPILADFSSAMICFFFIQLNLPISVYSWFIFSFLYIVFKSLFILAAHVTSLNCLSTSEVLSIISHCNNLLQALFSLYQLNGFW